MGVRDTYKNIRTKIKGLRKRERSASQEASMVQIWEGLLTLSAFLVLVTALLAIYLFLKTDDAAVAVDEVTDEGVMEDAPAVEVETLSQRQLEDMLDFFERRTDRYEFLKNNPPFTVDPSI